MTTAARPVRAPSRMPVADSMYAPLVDVPTSDAKTHDRASTSIGFSTCGKLPSLSSMLPAAPTPTSVPSVSRNDISTSVSSTGRKLSLQHAGDVEVERERREGVVAR